LDNIWIIIQLFDTFVALIKMKHTFIFLIALLSFLLRREISLIIGDIRTKLHVCETNQRAYVCFMLYIDSSRTMAEWLRAHSPTRKQSGCILMDYTCRHRLPRNRGPLISPIIVYAWCVNIVFYRRIPTREYRWTGVVLTRWAPLSVLFDGTRSSVSRQHLIADHLWRETRESYDQWARCVSS